MAIKRKTGNTTEVKCAFCKGTGKDPFELLSPLSICQVCLGRGKVSVTPPTTKCAFCNGTGIYPGKRLTCTVCGGKGVVTIPKDAKLCTICKGTGQAPDDLPCLNCHGKGVA